MARSILVTSGKGGVGKTTTVANLGLALANSGQKVCVLDMDLGLKNLDLVMGLENRLVYDVKDIIDGKCQLHDALVQDKRSPNLFLLSVCKNVNLDKVKFEPLKNIFMQCEELFDIILLDSPAGIERGFQYAMHLCNEALCVIQLDISSLMDTDRVIGILLRNQIKEINLCVNRVNSEYIKKKIQCTVQEAVDYLSLPCVGIVYDDPLVQMGNNLGNGQMSPVTRECFEVMAKRLQDEIVEFPRFNKKTFLQKMLG